MLLIFGVSWVSAAVLFWFVYKTTQAPKEEKRVRILALTRDLPLGAMIRKTDLKPVLVSQKDVPKGAIFQEAHALNRVLLFPAGSNEALTLGKLSSPSTTEGITSTIEPGYRAMAVQITDTSGVAGLIQPNSRVDVLFTRPGSMAEAITSTILQNVKVLSIGRITQVGQTVDPKAPKMPVATLVVTPEEAQKLELAKNQGKISLSLRNPLDQARGAGGGPITTEALDPMISARLARAKKGRTTNLVAANLDDPKVWQDLTGEKKPLDEKKAEEERKKKEAKEAEKPRWVVDVYRGDKHVQELFR